MNFIAFGTVSTEGICFYARADDLINTGGEKVSPVEVEKYRKYVFWDL